MRFYDVDAGSILFDGADIRDLNIQWLRSNIGIVSQEPVLFSFSIKENIAYGLLNDDQVSMNDIIDVCKASNIHDRIQSLPDVSFI